MICDRCSGLMVTEQSPDTIDEPVLPWSPSVRCLNCGNIEDPVIRLNRSRPPSLGARCNRTARNARRAYELTN